MLNDADYKPSRTQIDAVLAFLPIFEQEDFVPSHVETPPGQFPYHVYAEEASNFLHALYKNGFVFPFDWPSWQEEAQRYYDKPKLLRTADLEVLRRLLTLHVRKERFSEGHLSAMIESGHIAAILRRLKALREAPDRSHREKPA